jgi:hypothetical protein
MERNGERQERVVEVRPPKAALSVRPEPNAPLLMRIVRQPFALAPSEWIRVVLVPPPPDDARRGPSGPLSGAAPVRPRPRFVPRPFARRRGR